MEKLKIGILGYGNLGRGVEAATAKSSDMELFGIFTRRDVCSINPLVAGVPVYSLSEAKNHVNDIDVMVLCGGSATDLMSQTPEFASKFNVVDSFDTHAKIPEHFAAVDAAAKNSGHLAIISAGWDPGLFSINRLISESVLPNGKTYTFWGRGLSQGHSDAIRRIKGVTHAAQYTVPITEAVESVREGSSPILSSREMHKRDCFVVIEQGADENAIRNEIVSMPNYFADYDTTVTFISKEDFLLNHGTMPHGGFVVRSGSTGLNDENNHVYEFSLKLDSNPEFTASALVAYARAAGRMSKEGQSGAKTVLDIPPSYLSPNAAEELRKRLL